MDLNKLFGNMHVLGGVVLCAPVSYQLGATHFDVVPDMTEWFLLRESVAISLFLVTALIALICCTAGRRGSRLAVNVEAIYGYLIRVYSSTAGAVIGWVFGLAAAATMDSPQDNFGMWTYVLMTATVFMLTPLVGVQVCKHFVDEYNSRWYTESWRGKFVRSLGHMLLPVAFFLLWSDLHRLQGISHAI